MARAGDAVSGLMEESARKAGALFYTLPSELNIDEQIDPLLRAAVRAINRSGLVWTAECCQGHPDETDLHAPWGFSVEPYLRMVSLKIHLAWAVETLLEAAHDDDDASLGPVGMRLYTRPLKDGWVEFKVYATATNAATRNRGCRALERFGFAVEREIPHE